MAIDLTFTTQTTPSSNKRDPKSTHPNDFDRGPPYLSHCLTFCWYCPKRSQLRSCSQVAISSRSNFPSAFSSSNNLKAQSSSPTRNEGRGTWNNAQRKHIKKTHNEREWAMGQQGMKWQKQTTSLLNRPFKAPYFSPGFHSLRCLAANIWHRWFALVLHWNTSTCTFICTFKDPA